MFLVTSAGDSGSQSRFSFALRALRTREKKSWTGSRHALGRRTRRLRTIGPKWRVQESGRGQWLARTKSTGPVVYRYSVLAYKVDEAAADAALLARILPVCG